MTSTQPPTGRPLNCWVLFVLLSVSVSAWLCPRIPPRTLDARGALLAVPVLGAVATNVSNYVTGDCSAAAQIFLIAPVLVGAAKFRAPAAALAAAIAVAGDAWVTFSLAEPARAFTLLALSVSIGVAQLPTGDVRELYAAADEALYRAKRAGRDQLVVAGA